MKNSYATKPNKFRIKEANSSIYDYYDKGPTFDTGHDINIYKNFLNNNNHSINFPQSFEENLRIGNQYLLGIKMI